MTPRLALLLVAFCLVLLPWLVWRVPAVRRVVPLASLQIVAGLLLGPTGFGRAAPGLYAALVTPALLAQLGGLATAGALLYVVVAGLHLDAAALRRDARRLAAPAVGSVAAPLALGFVAGWWMADHVPGAVGPAGSPLTFAAAVAISAAVTALPVLAAILQEMGEAASPLGQAALGIAAANDAALWLMVAVLLAAAAGTPAAAAWTAGAALLWFLAIVGGVRPALARLATRLPPGGMVVPVLATAIASAAVSEWIGLGYITGAFAAGAAVPPALRAPLLAVLEPLTAAVLLPFFFGSTGLRAFVDPASATFTAVLAVSVAAAAAGKVAGTALPARLAGTPWPEALALGSLLQAKGLMEVLVLVVMADAGLIGPPVFSALVAMAVVCTVAATPLARLAQRYAARD